jgi:hypothetical protein
MSVYEHSEMRGKAIWTGQGELATSQSIGKPASPDWHPTTIPDYESPFYLGFDLPSRGYLLSRHGESRPLVCRVWDDDIRLGCTYVSNETIREMYWWSNASPRWLRWLVRMWDGWRRKGIR